MHRVNLFGRCGWLFIIFGMIYAYCIRQQYAGKYPHSSEEWLAEIFVGILTMFGAAMICVGKYLGSK